MNKQATCNLDIESNTLELSTNNIKSSAGSSKVESTSFKKTEVEEMSQKVEQSSTSKISKSQSFKLDNKSSKTEDVKTEVKTRDTKKENEAAVMIEQAKKYSDTIIESVSMDENNEEICGNDTKQKLNEMFDELVSEQNTMEIIESSEQSGTVKRRQVPPKAEDTKKTEKKIIITATTTKKADNEDSNTVLAVPQSPKEIRKMFQQPAVFEKSYSKVSEVELPAELQAGLQGKVRQSRETFLKQTESETKTGTFITEVPPSPREARKKFLAGPTNEEENIRNQELRQAKLEELAAVRASRAKVEQEAFLDQQVVSAGAREREERAMELVQLSSRRQEEQEAGSPVYMEDKELQLREERNRELASLAGRTGQSAPKEEPAGRERRAREERASELAAVATRTVEHVDWGATGDERTACLRLERQRELEELALRPLELPVREGETKEQELRSERARELAELSRRPTGTASPQLIAASEQLEEVTEELRLIAETGGPSRSVSVTQPEELSDAELRSRVRNTAASWREREQAMAAQATGSRQPEPLDQPHHQQGQTTPQPTRRIGSLFKKDPDYWKLSSSMEEIPGSDFPEPPPPPRQSSRGKVEEYRAPWRKS